MTEPQPRLGDPGEPQSIPSKGGICPEIEFRQPHEGYSKDYTAPSMLRGLEAG